MLAVAEYELPKLHNMLQHIQDHSAAFGAILEFLETTGIPPAGVDEFEVILINVVGEAFGLQFCVGSRAAFDVAISEVAQEELNEGETDSAQNFLTLRHLVHRFLNNIT